jgi:hypothetical protein
MRMTVVAAARCDFDHSHECNEREQCSVEPVLVPKEVPEPFAKGAPRWSQRSQVPDDIAAMRKGQSQEALAPGS